MAPSDGCVPLISPFAEKRIKARPAEAEREREGEGECTRAKVSTIKEGAKGNRSPSQGESKSGPMSQ